MEPKPLLPTNSWKNLLQCIKLIGERGSPNGSNNKGDYQFLVDMGIIEKLSGNLTEDGMKIFKAAFIRRDGTEKEVVKELLLRYPPTVAVQQYLWGVKDIEIDQVLTVLKTTGLWFHASTEPLTHFLDLLNYAGVISYNKKQKRIKVLISPDRESVPVNIFIDPSRPFSNIMWIKKILSECVGVIYWFDKHFQKEALDWLWAVADANQIKEIRILSLDLGDVNLNTDARKIYKRFRDELSIKGINVSWSTIESKLVRDSHDRWILDNKKYLRNVPNVNAISSGQRSEMNLSDNYEEVHKVFTTYWKLAVPVG